MRSTLGRRAALAACGAAVIVAAALPAAASASSGNSLGVKVVRFAKGTTPAQMRAAVANAGGDVVTDLSQIGALAVITKDAAADKALKADKSVKSMWLDRVTAMPRSVSPGFTPDPLHDATSFWGETNPEGILQWDDNRNGARQAWQTTAGSPAVTVAVIDSGIQPSHIELRDSVVKVANAIPCSKLDQIFGVNGLGKYGIMDCSKDDTEGHGTWVASRIVGAVNGIGSNGIAPNVKLEGFKALAAGFGGLTSWIADAMVQACDDDVDAINMSLGGYDDPFGTAGDESRANAEDYFLWKDAVDYCRSKGTAIFASAGNEHVKVQRTSVTLTGFSGTRTMTGAGRVVSTTEGINALPGQPAIAKGVNDYRGTLETPAGVPGVVMVSATGNAIPQPDANVLPQYAPPATAVGTKDNLAYYSSYGSRVDVAAPGGGRKYGIPRFDVAPGKDVLYGGWGELGAIARNGDICKSPDGAPDTFACFTIEGWGFAWLQGTSMSSPEATGVAALALSAKPALREHPDALAAQLESTARAGSNHTGISSADKGNAYDGTPCSTGFCHVDWTRPVSNADAYGAGIVNAGAAVK